MLLAALVAVYLVGRAIGVPPEPPQNTAATWSQISWLQAARLSGRLGMALWACPVLLAAATWLNGRAASAPTKPPRSLAGLARALASPRPTRWATGFLVAALLAPTAARWTHDAVVWPCKPDHDFQCQADDEWYRVHAAARSISNPGDRFLTPYAEAGFEQFSERESVLQWLYLGESIHDRAWAANDLERLRFDLTSTAPAPSKPRPPRNGSNSTTTAPTNGAPWPSAPGSATSSWTATAGNATASSAPAPLPRSLQD